jgi:hypothetical protein
MPPLPFDVSLMTVPTRDDFGYFKRNKLASRAITEFIGFFCQDDSYDNRYIEIMLAVAARENADVVWCPWNDIPTCEFRGESSTLGNFIVRTRLFNELGGFPKDPRGHGWRDAALIEKLRSYRVASANLLLYKHNVPFLPGTRTTRWGQVI